MLRGRLLRDHVRVGLGPAVDARSRVEIDPGPLQLQVVEQAHGHVSRTPSVPEKKENICQVLDWSTNCIGYRYQRNALYEGVPIAQKHCLRFKTEAPGSNLGISKFFLEKKLMHLSSPNCLE